MKVKVLVLERSSPCRSRPGFLPLLSCKVSPSRIFHIDTSSRADSLLVPSTLDGYRQRLQIYKGLLLQFHRLTAAAKNPIAAAGNDKLRTAFLTNISLPYLICHLLSSLVPMPVNPNPPYSTLGIYFLHHQSLQNPFGTTDSLRRIAAVYDERRTGHKG
jgi:hypothetical protein